MNYRNQKRIKDAWEGETLWKIVSMPNSRHINANFLILGRPWSSTINVVTCRDLYRIVKMSRIRSEWLWWKSESHSKTTASKYDPKVRANSTPIKNYCSPGANWLIWLSDKKGETVIFCELNLAWVHFEQGLYFVFTILCTVLDVPCMKQIWQMRSTSVFMCRKSEFNQKNELSFL